MTAPERVTFKKLVDTHSISFFRMATCQRDGCEVSIPKGDKKRFCSEECFRKEEDHGSKPKEEDEESW